MRVQCNTPRPAFIYLLACVVIPIASPQRSLAQQRGGAFAPAPPLKVAEDKPAAISAEVVSLRVSVTDKKATLRRG